MIRVETARRRVLLGYLAALGAAFCYGSLALVARKITTDYAPPMVATAFSMLFGTVILGAIVHRHATAFSMLFGTVILGAIVHRHALDDAPRTPRRGWLMIALAGCASTWGLSFWFLALSKAQVVLVAPVVGVEPLVSIGLTRLFLRRLERVTRRTVVGAIFVVGGVALMAIGT